LRRVYGQAAALIGVLFFFIIVGVFGLELTIAGLAADSMCQPCVCSYTYVPLGVSEYALLTACNEWAVVKL